MEKSEHEVDVEVDFFKLEENWRDQSRLYMKWSEKWANAVEERDNKKRGLDLLIRDFPDKYGLKANPSEASVKAKVETDEEYIKITKKINFLASVKTAFEHRKQSLEGLTKLFIAGYFTIPNLPRELKEALKNRAKEAIKEERKQLLTRSPRLSKLGKN